MSDSSCDWHHASEDGASRNIELTALDLTPRAWGLMLWLGSIATNKAGAEELGGKMHPAGCVYLKARYAGNGRPKAPCGRVDRALQSTVGCARHKRPLGLTSTLIAKNLFRRRRLDAVSTRKRASSRRQGGQAGNLKWVGGGCQAKNSLATLSVREILNGTAHV